MSKKYEIIETFATIEKDRFSFNYQYSIQNMDVEKLILDYYDFEPHVGKRVKVIIMIEDENE